MGTTTRATAAIGLTTIASLGAIAVHVYATYIAYHDGAVAALVTFVAPPLSDIFWFAVAWDATGTPFTLYGIAFIAVLVAYGLSYLLMREDFA
jgi:hypothetical protein